MIGETEKLSLIRHGHFKFWKAILGFPGNVYKFAIRSLRCVFFVM
jgi:hypothetical protein